MLPIFIVGDSINYLRYASWYFESIRQLHISHPDVYEQFKANHMFVVKTNTGSFNAEAADMKLEQTIQRSKKGAVGTTGQTKQSGFVSEWELVYHEISYSEKIWCGEN